MDVSKRTLVIDTASEACSIALFDGNKELASDHRVMGRGHAERLIPMIEALPDKGRADRILVSLGPGSFTGVRIGIAAARALGVAWGAEVLGYPTLALVAARAWQPTPRPVTVCMNGGHGEWFVQNFTHDSPEGPARSLTPEAAMAAGAHDVIVGNRAQEFAAMFDDNRLALDLLPDASAAHLLHESRFTSDCAPIYGRAPDAKPQASKVPS
ncbi:tRNA (adenosine(37)-N6)-threonylcarbamoyltransferase complex dimerization subunit type 1 TsaB [Erythrobacter sp. SCSIO 43205]|uniref:tRNA (adenosine(37)-N6)-threonylcarbamoyltransferase complex dimerization subunit type 1 TsaB n=1 Tax=Erythrobacter sp. SCSIO 43205 TaxID=2779361 RepID=UPI001CA82BDB|nr:tRNA (adenosine(37)-N6)-threonylcarbamoyltransferase complex dimerization subunit type 1 TsaB [Erythrobacter sp. SCSIO 43205]UAB77532.1 tRNA (adenosine(37)-N6)-threonylcarbamoyltransferase complex dimerization subunit type 1 TsaB [Erythrobacter sp. SCSIO 43205]